MASALGVLSSISGQTDNSDNQVGRIVFDGTPQVDRNL